MPCLACSCHWLMMEELSCSGDSSSPPLWIIFRLILLVGWLKECREGSLRAVVVRGKGLETFPVS